ncbi:MAG: hypothetical protein QM775_10245 [Pirellulales bacterium]
MSTTPGDKPELPGKPSDKPEIMPPPKPEIPQADPSPRIDPLPGREADPPKSPDVIPPKEKPNKLG